MGAAKCFASCGQDDDDDDDDQIEKMKRNSSTKNHEENGPENLKLLQVPKTSKAPSPPTTPTSRDLEDVFKDLPITDDTSCGIWCFRGRILQKFANKKAYVFLYGVLGCIFSASYAYFNGTITTIEKRFKIPSKTTGAYCTVHYSSIFIYRHTKKLINLLTSLDRKRVRHRN